MDEYVKIILAGVFVAIAVVALIVFAAAMESSTYNKLCDGETTWFDALWVELRIESCGASK